MKLQPGTSNAPAGYPTHSPEGFPLFYSIGGDGKPVGAPKLWFKENTFVDAKEVAAWVVAMAQRDDNLAAWQRDFNTPGSPEWPLFTEEEEKATLALFDAAPEAYAYYALPNAEHSALLSRLSRSMGSDSRAFIAGKMQEFGGGGPPEGYFDSDIGKARAAAPAPPAAIVPV